MTLEETIEAAVERGVARALEKLREQSHAPELLTYAEAAALAKVEASTVESWVRRGLLNRYGSERHPRVRRDEVLNVKPKPNAHPDAEEFVSRILAKRKH